MIKDFEKKKPQVGAKSWIANSAEIIGDCRIAENCSIWFGCVLRADINYIEIGNGSNVQDGTVVHVDTDFPVEIGENVTIGHKATIHGCKIGTGCLIGMSATILDGAEIGEGSIVAAGAVVTPKKKYPPKSLLMGIPAKIVKTISEKEVAELIKHAQNYAKLKDRYLK
ncbi:MAG: gamma carbonic anhydrase family protein [Candidatus Cloacimonadota bacterium]|nr:gamma carbonic anhydrase family protein [Candidatus Cloacimonadota bacterium]